MRKAIDFCVVMNPETAKEDVLGLRPGTVVRVRRTAQARAYRDDLVFYPVPFDKIVAEVTKEVKLRRLVRNMLYCGVLSHLLSIDMKELENAIDKQLGHKMKAVQLNTAALEVGRKYAADNFQIQHPYKIERMNKTAGMILVDGNDAAAMGCSSPASRCVAWYPITPSSGLPEALTELPAALPHRQDDGEGDVRDRAGRG